MPFSFGPKKKLLRVLRTANRGVLTIGEISEHLRMSETSVRAYLRRLEDRSLVVSGDLMPAGLKIYRVTSKGKDCLAVGFIR